MPRHNRQQPEVILVCFACPNCSKNLKIRMKGDWINRTCWNCGNGIAINRFPPPIRIVTTSRVVTDFDVQVEKDDEDV